MNSFSQSTDTEDHKETPQSTYYANTLSVHPLGIFKSRVNNNFQLRPDKKFSVELNLSNGNVWLPLVTGYKPLNQSDRQAMSQLVWSLREFRFNTDKPAEKLAFEADGILRRYQLQLNFPIKKNHEIKMRLNMFSLDPGNMPYSFLTNDQIIEWFHSNIAGGEDPFARKYYGFNHAYIKYVDSDQKSIELENGDFFYSNIQFSYYYYPKLDFLTDRNIFSSIGVQTGINTNSANSSIDLGGNYTIQKRINLNNHNKEIRFGISFGALRQNLILFKEGVEISDKKYLLHSEVLFEYVKFIQKNTYISWATSWFLQSSYHKKIDYLVLSGNRVASHWHYALSHLQRPLSANNIVFTYGKSKYAIWLYLREDGLVDNAPDVQTGIGFKWFIKK